MKMLLKLGITCQTIIILLVSTSLFSQENPEKLLLMKANELAFADPDEAIKIADHLLKKAKSDEDIVNVNLLLTRGYNIKGDYNKAVNYIFEASKNSKSVTDSLKTEILFLKAELSLKLHLYNQADNYLSETEGINDGHSDATEARIGIEKAKMDIERQKYTEALRSLKEIEKKYKNAIAGNYTVKQDLTLTRAQALSGIGNYKASEQNFDLAFSDYQAQKKPNKVFETEILYGFGKIYFERKEYEKAISALLMSLDKAVQIKSTALQEDSNYLLAASYLAMNNKTLYQKYHNQFLPSYTTSNDMEIEAVNSMYSFIGKEQDSNYEAEKNKLVLYTYIASGILILLVISGTILYSVNKAKRKRLKEIIGYLEVTNNLLVKSYAADKKESNKKIAISTETEQNILAKLKRFEASTKYTNKDMSLATLAAQLDVNTKYLSEIINKHYQDNFNTYINRLRINYIIEKLKAEPEYLHYKISYLADECGFSSHSSFATVFKSITGIAPTIFIELIGKEVNKKKA